MPGKPADTTEAIRGTAGADSPSALLYFIAAAAVLFGLWGRFKGLGTWPLSDDEYYTARAVQDILRAGTPEYDCGGWYTRGLPFQYVSAALQLAGLGPELSLRIVTALSSLLVLPAAYLLGKRAHGKTAGLLTVTILAASLWEIELARFGRMYAPFQAVFAWSLVFFVRYVVDRDTRAFWPMLGLSVLGPLVWEGGIFILALTALPPFIGNTTGRLKVAHIAQILLAGALVAAVFVLNSGWLRYWSDVPPFPEGIEPEFLGQSDNGITRWQDLASLLRVHPGWLLLIALPAVTSIPALGWIWRFRDRWVAAAGLLLVLLLSLAHQFGLAASVLLIMLLSRLLMPQDLLQQGVMRFAVVIGASLVAWSCLGLFSDLWIHPDAVTWLGEGRWFGLFQEFFGRPDILGQIIRPWVGAASIHGLVLLLALVVAVVNDLRSPSRYTWTLSVLLLVLVSMLIAVGLSTTPRQETRYVFFLYPVAIIVAVVTALIFLPRWLPRFARPAPAAPLAVLLGFALLEDFQPKHVISIDSAEVNFRVGLRGRADGHIIGRTDPRGAAQWIDEHAAPYVDLLVNGYPAASFYSDHFDFAYTDLTHQRYFAFACQRGTVERWSNLPLLSTTDALATEMDGRRNTYFVADRKQEALLLAELAPYHPTVVWRSIDGAISVVRMTHEASSAGGR